MPSTTAARPGVRLANLRLSGTGLTVAAGWIGRAVAAGAQFLVIRILSQVLGVENYGAYAVIVGLLGFFALADFGFGSALQNHISASRVAKGSAEAAIWSTAALLAITTPVVIALLIGAAFWIGPELLDGFTQVTDTTAAMAFAAFAIIASGIGAAAFVLRIYFAEHRGYVAHIAAAAGALLGLAALQLLGLFSTNKLVWALVLYNLPNLLIPLGLIAGRALQERRRAGLHLWGHVDRQVIGLLWRDARTFLLFNVLSTLVLNVDYIILSQTVAPRQIATYAILARYYTLVFFVFNSVLQAYWPVSAEAFSRGVFTGVRKMLVRGLAFGFAIVLGASIILLIARGPLSRILSPNDPVDLPMLLIGCFTGYWMLRIWSDMFGMLIMSAGRPLFLSAMVFVQAVLNVTLGYFGARSFGLYGLLAGLAASFLLTGVWVAPLYALRLRRLAEGRAQGVPVA